MLGDLERFVQPNEHDSYPRDGVRSAAGFTLARANARMLINAEAKRRSARNSVRASRPQCTSAVAVIG